MSARVFLAAAAAGLGLAAAAPGVAHADRKAGGPIGIDRNFILQLGIGGLKTEVLRDANHMEPYESDGNATMFRLRGGGYLDTTHYGRLVGVEGSMGIGWFDKAALIPPVEMGEMEPEAPQVWGRLYLDFDITMLVDVVRLETSRWLPPSRASFIGGFGLSTDFAYFYLGGRLHGRLGKLQGEIEYHRRFGESHSDPNQREERVHVHAYYGSFGLGFEAVHGYSEDITGAAATDRVFRGGYTMTTLSLIWVVK